MYRKFLPLLIISIAVIILFGNFILFDFLLEKTEDELIGKTGIIKLSNNYVKSSSTDVSLIDVITNLVHSSSYGIVHQPFENQLSKKEAIQISKSTIIKFIQNGIILNNNDIEKRITNEKNYSATLNTKADNTIQLNPLYSLWHITYSDDDLKIYICLSATTGDVLNLVVSENLENSIQNSNVLTAEECLNLYLEYLKLEDLKIDFIKYEETYARCKLKDTNNVYLIVSYMLDKKMYYLNMSFSNEIAVKENDYLNFYN